jgi:predicted enzyme related to lactoylglutathione lyase
LAHEIVHIEIPAKDTKAGSQFYADMFGWKMQTDDNFNYTMFQAGSGPGGGFTQVDGEHTNPGDVLIYVDTEDIDASLAKAQSLGGAMVVPKTEIPGMGWFAVMTDPTGNRIGLWTTTS